MPGHLVVLLLAQSFSGLASLGTDIDQSLKQEDGQTGYLSQPDSTGVQFLSRYVDHRGVIHYSKPSSPVVVVQASSSVSELAIEKAATTVSRMVRHTPFDVFLGLSKAKGVGIFTREETLAIFPENQHLKDTPECHGRCNGSCSHTCTADGRKYQTIAGVTNHMSVVLEDNVLCNDKDPYSHQLNVLSHEFSHQIFKSIPSSYRHKIQQAYYNAQEQHLWSKSYATTTPHEYWAESTTAFFLTSVRGRALSGGMNMCNHMSTICPNEMEARKNIQSHDPKLFELLEDIYTNGNVLIPSGLRPCM